MHGHAMYRSYDFAEVWEFECQMERFLVIFDYPNFSNLAHWSIVVF